MSVLNDKALKQAVDHGLIRDMIHARTQIQQCGVELTLAKVERFNSSGAIAFDNKERALPKMEELEFLGIGGYLRVMPGAYLITFNETVKIPIDMMAIARPRSSLLRMGVTVETAVFDPGYEGVPKAMLVVTNSGGFSVKKDARLVQLIFMPLTGAAESGYNGAYQHET